MTEILPASGESGSYRYGSGFQMTIHINESSWFGWKDGWMFQIRMDVSDMGECFRYGWMFQISHEVWLHGLAFMDELVQPWVFWLYTHHHDKKYAVC